MDFNIRLCIFCIFEKIEQMSKKTLVVGASKNPDRYSYKAIQALRSKGHEVHALGLREDEVSDVKFFTEHKPIEALDTITLYVNPTNQKKLYDYLLSLNAKRIVFNPGTENPELAKFATDNGAEAVYGCTLVMLSLGKY